MNFRELETFMKLIECGSYSRAAKELFISQPTATTRIKVLEDELGIPILMRSGKGYRPTEAGAVLAGYAGRMLQIQDECLKALNQMRNLNAGILRIGATALGTYILPDMTERFKEQYPEARLFFSISNTSEALDGLRNGLVDAVLASLSLDTEKSDGFHYASVGHDALVLAASTQNPISRLKRIHIHDLRAERFIIREKGSNTRKVFEEWLRKNGFDISNVAELGQSEAIRRAVAKNAGISALSALSLQPDDTSIKKLDIEGFPVLREVYVVTRSEEKHDSLVDAFSAFVKEFMKEYRSLGEPGMATIC